MELDNAGATTRAVADDMSAIFGSNSRAVAVLPASRKPASARSTMPNRLLLAVCVGTLSATVAAGIYAGDSVIDTSVETRTPRAGARVPHRAERRENDTPRVTADAIAAVPAPSPPSVSAAVPDPVRETPPVPDSPATAARPSPLPGTPASLSAVAPVAHRPSSATALPPASSAPASVQRYSCDNDGDLCVAPRAEVAEQRVADAYERAVRAGVRSRDLRGYHREWDRARGVAVEQPRYALRLYAMITSDLLNLADDAEARDDVTER